MRRISPRRRREITAFAVLIGGTVLSLALVLHGGMNAFVRAVLVAVATSVVVAGVVEK